jgi:hypothetical protein
VTEPAQQLSDSLQAAWALDSPAKEEIHWVYTRPETVDFAALNKSIVLACYNPADALKSEAMSREAWMLTESLHVDILVRVTSGYDDALSTRDAMRTEVYRIIHGLDPIYSIVREPFKVESPEAVRLAILVHNLSFHLKA